MQMAYMHVVHLHDMTIPNPVIKVILTAQTQSTFGSAFFYAARCLLPSAPLEGQLYPQP